jgi:hypothetical protein
MMGVINASPVMVMIAINASPSVVMIAINASLPVVMTAINAPPLPPLVMSSIALTMMARSHALLAFQLVAQGFNPLLQHTRNLNPLSSS